MKVFSFTCVLLLSSVAFAGDSGQCDTAKQCKDGQCVTCPTSSSGGSCCGSRVVKSVKSAASRVSRSARRCRLLKCRRR